MHYLTEHISTILIFLSAFLAEKVLGDNLPSFHYKKVIFFWILFSFFLKILVLTSLIPFADKYIVYARGYLFRDADLKRHTIEILILLLTIILIGHGIVIFKKYKKTIKLRISNWVNSYYLIFS